MDKDTRNLIIFIIIAIVFGSGAAEWFLLNVILGPIIFFIETLEWAAKTPNMPIYLLIITLIILLLKQEIGDFIQTRLGL